LIELESRADPGQTMLSFLSRPAIDGTLILERVTGIEPA
jgi:hypothetical protein